MDGSGWAGTEQDWSRQDRTALQHKETHTTVQHHCVLRTAAQKSRADHSAGQQGNADALPHLHDHRVGSFTVNERGGRHTEGDIALGGEHYREVEGECHKPWRRKKITCNAWVLVSVPSEGIPPIIFPLGPQALSQGPLPPHPRLSNHVCLLPSLSTAPPTLSSPHSLSCPSPSRHPSHQ